METDLIHIDIQKAMFTNDGVLNLEVNTVFNAGEIIAIYGASGAGKTTLLRIIAGLANPDKGTITVGNSVFYDKKTNLPPQKRNIGFMFQDYALFPNMTVKENIQFAQKSKDSVFTNRILCSFGIAELKNRKPNSLSGGQKQRVALARALAQKPEILLLDEPLSALDQEKRTELQNEIKLANKNYGTTIILVSHDISEVFKLANKVLVLDKGKIIKQGLPNKVFTENKYSGKFQFVGKILTIEKEDIIYIITILIEQSIVKIVANENEIADFEIGNNVIVSSKAFNPLISKI